MAQFGDMLAELRQDKRLTQVEKRLKQEKYKYLVKRVLRFSLFIVLTNK